jgi:hypothetical protein
VATGYADTNGDRIPDDVSAGVNIGKLSFSDGALLSTAHDLGKFVRGIFQSNFLSEASHQELMTTVNAEEDPSSGIKYGVGTAMVENTSLGNAYFFSGATQGYRATYLFLPDLDTVYAECIPVLQICPHPPTPSPVLGEGELDQSPSPKAGEGFRVRAAKVRCTRVCCYPKRCTRTV